MARALSWQRPSSAPAPPQGAPSGCGQLGTPPQAKPRPLGAQPSPLLLEPAASKVVDLDFTGCDRAGMHFSISVKNINAQAAAGLTSASSAAAASAVALAELVSAQEVARVFGVGVGVGVGAGVGVGLGVGWGYGHGDVGVQRGCGAPRSGADRRAARAWRRRRGWRGAAHPRARVSWLPPRAATPAGR